MDGTDMAEYDRLEVQGLEDDLSQVIELHHGDPISSGGRSSGFALGPCETTILG